MNKIIIFIFIIYTLMHNCYAFMNNENMLKIKFSTKVIKENIIYNTDEDNNKIFKLLLSTYEILNKEQTESKDSYFSKDELNDLFVKSKTKELEVFLKSFNNISVDVTALKHVINNLPKNDFGASKESVERILDLLSLIESFTNTEQGEIYQFSIYRILYQISEISKQYNDPSYLIVGKNMVHMNSDVFNSLMKKSKKTESVNEFDYKKSVGNILKSNNIVPTSIFDIDYYYKQFVNYIYKMFNTTNYVIILSVLVVLLILMRLFVVIEKIIKTFFIILFLTIKTIYVITKYIIKISYNILKITIYYINLLINKRR